MKFVAGIDGGGTGTTLVIESLESGEKTAHRFGPFNINSIGRDAFCDVLEQIFSTIDKTGECKGICFGAAGISNPLVSGLIQDKAKKYKVEDILMLKGDQDIALYGAMDGGPGAMIIVGTGSIGLGRDDDGNVVRVGGWGHLIDDCGSGYAIGRDVLSAYVQAADGRIEPTLLTELVNDRWRVRTPQDIVAKIYPQKDKALIASLSVLADTAARENDDAALEILNKAADDAVGIVEAMFRQLKVQDKKLALMGGLLSNGTVLSGIFTEKISKRLPDVKIVPPAMYAADGAVLWVKNEMVLGEKN